MGNNLNVNVPKKMASEDNLENPHMLYPTTEPQIRQLNLNYIGSKSLIGYQVFTISESL